jgi:hypothetical protein
MTTSNITDTAIPDEAVQQTQIARLKQWIKTVSRRKSQIPLCEGLTKLIELGRLKYGTWLTPWGLKTGFAAVPQSDEVHPFLDERVAPVNDCGSPMLELFADGSLLMELGHRNGIAEFIFYTSAEHSHRVR